MLDLSVIQIPTLTCVKKQSLTYSLEMCLKQFFFQFVTILMSLVTKESFIYAFGSLSRHPWQKKNLSSQREVMYFTIELLYNNNIL